MNSSKEIRRSSSTKWDRLCKDGENSRKRRLVDLGGLTGPLVCGYP